MWFKHRAWIPVAWLLSLGNVAAVWFAAAPAEPLHATTHAMLAVLSALGAHHLMTRRPAHSIDDGRFERLQQGIDVIGLEIERISEGQRYLTKVLDARQQESLGHGEAQALPLDRKDVAPSVRSNAPRD